jgi:DNA-binding NtrC family response regulator
VGNILVCDDERSICQMLDIALRRDGHKVETVNSGAEAKRKLDGALYDLVVTDIKMPNIDGIEVLRYAHQVSPDSAVILITAVDDYEAAVQAVKAGGAADYIRKSPGLVDEIKLAINRALEKAALSRQNFAFKRDAANRNSLENIVGASPAMDRLKHTIRTVASTQSTILIYGESGTGKELVARAVHICSPRAAEPFVSINCGAFPETLLESELFGYVKGAFTGANQNKRGLFEVADQGTIFLDEISEMHPALQAKLLHVLQDHEFSRLGGKRDVQVDVRVLAATNKPLERAVEEGVFREDLFYRLNVVTIHIPPLRERREEIPVFLKYFLEKYSEHYGKKPSMFSEYAVTRMMEYAWPGNIRELENMVKRYVIVGNEAQIIRELATHKPIVASFGGMTTQPVQAAAAVPAVQASNGAEIEMPSLLEIGRRAAMQAEREAIERVLAQTRWNRRQAAKILKISYKALLNKLKAMEDPTKAQPKYEEA